MWQKAAFLPFKKYNILVWVVFVLEQWFNIESSNFHRRSVSRVKCPFICETLSFLAKMTKKPLQARCALCCAVVGLAAVQRYA